MKQKLIMVTGGVMLAIMMALSLYGIGQSLASGSLESEYDSDDEESYRDSSQKMNPAYVEECGSCHMAYPPSLLPVVSWPEIMQGLEDHFGENAELDAQTSEMLERYLVEVAEAGGYRKLFRNLGDRAPLRITELPYFIHEHDEIPSRFIRANDKLQSLSQCNACHQNAERGEFDEDDVFIPGVGRWHD